MWPNNNAFGTNGQFQNNFNQDGYPPSPFAGQAIPGQQYFAQQPNMMQFEDGNSEGFQPEVGLFNSGAYSQNQFTSSGPPQFSPAAYDISPPAAPAPRPPPAQINARAAELKAQLLALQKGRANSGTPPIQPNLALATKQTTRGEGSSSLRESPKTPISAADKQERERNLTELISQYSEPKPEAASVKKENNNHNASSIQRIPVHMGAKSQAPSLGSPTNIMKAVKNGSNSGGDGEKPVNNTANGKTLGKQHTSNGSVSEGEISDEQGPELKENTAAIRMKIIESQTGGIISNIEEPTSRRVGEERSEKPYRRPSRDESPPRRPPPTNPRSQVQRNRDDYRDEVDARLEKRPYESYRPEHKPEHKSETSLFSDSERLALQRRDRREEAARRPEPIEQTREEVINRPYREQKPPTLVDLLPLDEDLREWLEITGYHNATYRSKILNRRRAIAALDAQRDKLLAEMELDERGGVPPVTGTQGLPSSMLPPPIPNKIGDRAEPASRATGAVSSDSPRDRVVSNKRPHSDVDDQRSEVNGGGKLARIDDRSYQSERIKEEDGPEYRRPRSGGLNTPRRSPPVERREREPSPSRPRYGSRGRSRERDSSPGSGRRAFENRPAARGRGYDADSFWDREEFPEPRGRGGFMVRGNYRGRAYDPHYRSRGRGTGRGDSREGRDFNMNAEVKTESGYGSKNAGKPFKDLKGFSRGGRGDTRYFIVKSFNEENVIKCIQDGIWTTQVQNGSIFKDAFLNCKNVILVFSINKSRAFQGYARMESLPGSVPCPTWQRNINWESTGAFRVRWLVVCSTRFQRIGHLKNRLNDNLAVLIGKDGQEIEEECGGELIRLIGEEADAVLGGQGEFDGRW
ncbi:hypothetical protein VTL71DRAFT_781 [Oculimacula yallundae]|uniref:YTH domain-containing protein n=1 Tax=Oculimacula yallundae TaxID=86028 RepID=A0ABR4D132_9HELO